MAKGTAKLDGIPLAAVEPVEWRFQTGVQPFQTTYTVHRLQWPNLQSKKGQPLQLAIKDTRGASTTIDGVYILHEVPSNDENQVRFLVSDRRFFWQYRLIVRDYNKTRKTGFRNATFPTLPIGPGVIFDKYDFLPYSLDAETKWTAQRVVEDLLEALEDTAPGFSPASGGSAAKSYRIDNFPIVDGSGVFSVENLILRDQGDIALGRALELIPGAEVYIDAQGTAVVFDGADLEAAEQHLEQLPFLTRSGEWPNFVDRSKIRPSQVRVYYQREVECVFRFSDNYAGRTVSSPPPDDPYLENVIPTVDPQTTVAIYDPEIGRKVVATVPPGTWVEMRDWLAAMDQDKAPNSLPWTFETIRLHWYAGNLEAVLGAGGEVIDEDANFSMRVQALRQHFRQTFRINRRYMERIRQLLPVRVAILDPVSGARLPAAAWGQACFITARKYNNTTRTGTTRPWLFRNVDSLAASELGGKGVRGVADTTPGPGAVTILDHDLGVFRIDWIPDPFGITQSIIPCHLVGPSEMPEATSRDLSNQDSQAMGPGIQVEEGANGIFLRNTLDLAVMMTIVPTAPNDKSQCHVEEVDADQINPVFRSEFRIQGGAGPELEVFIAENEQTARFQWQDDGEAEATVKELLGLVPVNEEEGPRVGTTLNGFVTINSSEQFQGRHLPLHAQSVAAAEIAAFADSTQGRVTTALPQNGGRPLFGNMDSASIRVGTDGKIDVQHDFSGRQKPISRFSLMSSGVRTYVLGLVNTA